MAKVLVTGYGGFLGAEIARQLLRAGYAVRGVARGEYPTLVALGVEPMRGDIRDRDTALAAASGCEAIVHTAAKAGVWGRWDEYHAINTRATEHLLDAARRAGTRAFVFTSSPSVTFAGRHQSGVDESVPYPDRWLCHYPHTKALAERAVLEAGGGATPSLSTCALRPHLIWGPGDPHLFPRVVERARSGRLRRVGDGENRIDVVHVAPAAWAHVQSVRQLLDGDRRLDGRALFLTDGQPVACWEWITRIVRAADLPVPRGALSYAAAYRLGWVLERVYAALCVRREPPMTRFVAAQLALDHYFAIDRARDLLGYRPEVDRDAQFELCRPELLRIARGQSPR